MMFFGPTAPPGGERRGALVRPLATALGVHLVLAGLQFGGAWATGSAGITASALHVAIGSAAHVSALTGIWLSTRPSDPQHPYGYQRFESLSAFVVGMLLLASVLLISVVALPRLLAPRPLQQAGWGVVLMLASAGANVALYVFLRSRANRLASSILRSESVHALADSLTAVAVLGGVASSAVGLLHLDPLVAIVMAVVVAWRAWAVIRGAAAVLTDAVPVDIERLRQVALDVPGVTDAHAVRSRGEPGNIWIDLHIHVDPDLTVREAHQITLAVEAALTREIGGVAEVLVHVGGRQ